MISQTQEKDKDKIVLFYGNPQQLKQACAGNQTKLKLVNAVQTLQEWKAAVQSAREFLSTKDFEIQRLEKQLWQEIADDDRFQWPALKLLKTESEKLTAVYAHADGRITLEEVEIDE